jgi:hypothetical protein
MNPLIQSFNDRFSRVEPLRLKLLKYTSFVFLALESSFYLLSIL